MNETPAAPPTAGRIDSIDLLRGLVIVLMGLDHVRDFFSITPYRAEDLTQASAGLFLTRWVTHFCAPVFLLLAGLGAALYQARGRSRAELARFLLTRGLFLIVLEITVVNLSWMMIFTSGFLFLQVIWAIGWCMVLLAGLIWLPRRLLWVVCAAMVAGHNLLDGIRPQDFAGVWRHLWGILHSWHWIPVGEDFGIAIVYPLVPWVGVMGLGYLMGPLYAASLDPSRRRRLLLAFGGAATLAFIVLRALDAYGEPQPWEGHEGGMLMTALAFLNTTKYPPSLQFLLMTLGPALLVLPWLERAAGRAARFFVVFGRVPLFFYVVHIPVIHLLAALYAWARFGAAGWWFRNPQTWPEAYAPPDLPVAYAAWILVTLLLYPACRWYAALKRRRRHPLFSYL